MVEQKWLYCLRSLLGLDMHIYMHEEWALPNSGPTAPSQTLPNPPKIMPHPPKPTENNGPYTPTHPLQTKIMPHPRSHTQNNALLIVTQNMVQYPTSTQTSLWSQWNVMLSYHKSQLNFHGHIYTFTKRMEVCF